MTEDPDSPNWRLKPRQRSRARELRAGSTDVEHMLWSRLRGHRLEKLSFRRQHPIGPYIVDFVCLPCRLVVELDGGQHYSPVGQARDEVRDRRLAELGFRTLRFSNLDVLNNLEGVLATILEAALARRPPPNPPPQAGEGF